MFEVPNAKRVRREDLRDLGESDRSDGSDAEGDAELRAQLNAQIARSLGLSDLKAEPMSVTHKEILGKSGVAPPDSPDEAEQGEDDEEEGFEFRLFSTSTQAPKVILEDENKVTGIGEFVEPHRPLSYYSATTISAEQKVQYGMVAVSGDEVLSRSKHRSWGLELPWKVIRIQAGNSSKSIGEPGEKTNEDPSGRKRPGKKTRIAQRKKQRSKEHKAAEAAQKAVDKEEHLKDKKKRLNRAKKLRKRAKDKEKKQAGHEDGGGAEASGSDSEASS